MVTFDVDDSRDLLGLHGHSPPPKVKARVPLRWDRVWRRLWGSGLPPHVVNTFFMLANNILPLRARLAALGVGDGLCPHCGSPEDIRHLFLECARVRDPWDGFYSRVARILPAIPSDLDLLRLVFEVVST